MPDWALVAEYLSAGEGWLSKAGPSTQLDEYATIGRKVYSEGYGLDLTDETTLYALVVGLCTAFSHFERRAKAEVFPEMLPAFRYENGATHRDLLNVICSVLKDAGIEVPVAD